MRKVIHFWYSVCQNERYGCVTKNEKGQEINRIAGDAIRKSATQRANIARKKRKLCGTFNALEAISNTRVTTRRMNWNILFHYNVLEKETQLNNVI